MATPTLDDIKAEVDARCALMLADAGVYLLASGGSTPLIDQGIERGFNAVRFTLASPPTPTDADVALLSAYARQRVTDEATLFALEYATFNWWRVAQKDQEAYSSNVVSSGWRMDQKRALDRHVSMLKATCEAPYREPSSDVLISNVHRHDRDPACWPVGFGYGWDWGCP
jgi:hypothetical protein